ncbi:PRD domain-containing protein [Priestia taiwanensis]|uniref:Glycine dehydrogenase n=1 Tax=Priestia taiwanensis TaxID=1347902 RepID=A0A917AY58_9BACI|nr:PRD domain-containing protein [Priestia taiwanensis]MBM7364813.1 PRD domain protein (TIGR03582 family) [Priestia taiwanensis]GGE79886.1 glycine dehydrogenase [Priestia taiwanensis]
MSAAEVEAKITELIERSGDVPTCTHVLLFVQHMLKKECIPMTETQWISLVSHISFMVHRSVHGGRIPTIDKAMFDEVSRHSINLAESVCHLLPCLQEDEKYLLSIHFESAKRTNEGGN